MVDDHKKHQPQLPAEQLAAIQQIRQTIESQELKADGDALPAIPPPSSNELNETNETFATLNRIAESLG